MTLVNYVKPPLELSPMNQEEFQRYAQAGYNRIPIVHELLADLDTPLSTYVKLANQPNTYIFESMIGGERWGRYSIIGLPCNEIIKIYGHRIEIHRDDKIVEELTVNDPLEWVKQYQSRIKMAPVPGLPPRFNGGLVGYFAYDSVRYMEPRLGDCQLPDLAETPDILLMVSDEVIVFDNQRGNFYYIVNANPAQDDALAYAKQRIQDLNYQLRHCAWPENEHPHKTITEEDFRSKMGFPEYEQCVNKIRQYITDGDCMQVVFSRRISLPYKAPPLHLYRALRYLNPSPYMYFLNLGDHHIAGASPETLVNLENDEITVRPLAGTIHRGQTEEEDKALEEQLLSDEKEIAEHLMLIDLARNDVGRVAETGSVRVTEQMIIERYAYVMHISSNVVGKIRPNFTAIDALRATFPAGTLSGAPKVRAMEIIDELEKSKRGIYGGAVGYLGWNGNMDVAIAIRTALIKGNEVSTQAGGGIVYDSDAENEWQETIKKGRGIFRAVSLAHCDLDTEA